MATINSMSRFSSSRVANTMPVRPSRASDTPVLQEIARGCGAGQLDAETLEAAACWVVDGGPANAREDGVDMGVVGYVHLSLDGGQATVGGIGVRPEFQRQGLGTKLLAAGEVYAAQCGYSRVALAACSPSARPFFEKAGWSVADDTADSTKALNAVTPPSPPTHSPAPGMRELTTVQVEEFMERGHFVLKGAIDPELCKRWRDEAWERIGMEQDDPAVSLLISNATHIMDNINVTRKFNPHHGAPLDSTSDRLAVVAIE